jgi:hypothetical protein
MNPLEAYEEWFKGLKDALQSNEANRLLTLIGQSVRTSFLQTAMNSFMSVGSYIQ